VHESVGRVWAWRLLQRHASQGRPGATDKAQGDEWRAEACRHHHHSVVGEGACDRMLVPVGDGAWRGW